MYSLAHPLNLFKHTQEIMSKDTSQLILSPVSSQQFLD